VDNTLLDLQNSSYPTKRHSLLLQYYLQFFNFTDTGFVEVLEFIISISRPEGSWFVMVKLPENKKCEMLPENKKAER